MPPAATPPSSARKFKSGETLFKEGDIPYCIYIIKKGAVSIRKTKANSYVEVGKLSSNQVIGELSFFDRLPRSASAVAIMDVEVTEIPFSSMEKIYNQIPDYMRTIIAGMADRLRKANEQIRILQKQKEKAEAVAYPEDTPKDPPKDSTPKT
jgi:CRP/FNR family transcriptional regulator, cyclic AMP receptor protein